MPNTRLNAVATITARIGPGYSVTSLVLRDITAINFDYIGGTVQIFHNDGQGPKNPVFELSSIATVTYTVSGSTATLVLST